MSVTSSELREIAERVLTRKQLDVFRLWLAGAGTARIALMLDVSQSTVRSHLRRAQQKVMLELERQEAIQRVKDEREGRRRIDESGGLA